MLLRRRFDLFQRNPAISPTVLRKYRLFDQTLTRASSQNTTFSHKTYQVQILPITNVMNNKCEILSVCCFIFIAYLQNSFCTCDILISLFLGAPLLISNVAGRTAPLRSLGCLWVCVSVCVGPGVVARFLALIWVPSRLPMWYRCALLPRATLL